MVVELIHRLLHGKRRWATSRPHEVHTTHPDGSVTVTHISHGPIPHWPLRTENGATTANVQIYPKGEK